VSVFGFRGATVPSRKQTDHLLSATHPDASAKYACFLRFGFDAAAPEVLRQALLQRAIENPVVRSDETAFGTRLVVEGPLPSPDGRNPQVRSVWFVETGTSIPRLVTAHPVKRRTP
jgi:hypothetical protein